MFQLGLTGSIGMGKSTTARFFAEAGCRLWDADAAVHRLYARNGEAVAPLREAFPEAIDDGEVSRAALRKIISENSEALKVIEGIVHPLVAQDRAAFVAEHPNDILVFDIPLLFETGAERAMDAVACVTVPEAVQQERVMSRGTMTMAEFKQILSKQIPNTEKCARADFVIETDTIEHARQQVQDIVAIIRSRIADA